MTIATPSPRDHSPASCPVQALRHQSRCDICGRAFTVQVSRAELAAATRYPFTHLILHGNPIHCLVVYVDKQGAVRGAESSKSIQIDRTSATFQELVRWWAMTAEEGEA
ncbi:MAG: hypothetical protein GYA24_19705 [Candidatus Lokiarchaeota archaeon]|nr:hypothetical protein [Candidatus Lokiarchaeota archaeon]